MSGNRLKYDLTPELQRKMAKRIVIRIALLIAILIGVRVYFRFDVSPPDDKHLTIAPLSLPAERNAAAYFDRAAQELRWPEDTQMVREMLADNWVQHLAEELVAENAPALNLLNAGLALDAIQISPGVDNDAGSIYCPVSTLIQIEMQVHFNSGNEEEAFEAGLKLLRFGKMLQHSRSGLLNYMHGIEMRRQALERMRSFLATSTLSARKLDEFSSRLAELQPCNETLSDALRSGYSLTLQRIDAYPRGFFFLPNATKRLYATTYRRCLFDATRPRRLHMAGMPASVDDIEQKAPFWELVGYVGRNSMGRGLHKYDIVLGRLMESKCRENTDFAATRILFALKSYTADNGALPETLDELVPQYFKEVPASDYDGRPIRYSTENAHLHCQGEEGEPLIYPIDWAEQPTVE